MKTTHIQLHDESESRELQTFLVDRVYEFNSRATGYFDGRAIAASLRNQSGEIVAGLNGHTWGGCCVIAHLWVSDAYRRQGMGRALMIAAQDEALRRGCDQIILSTHSFQAPGFYERLGFAQVAIVPGHPKGYADIHYAKRLVRTM